MGYSTCYDSRKRFRDIPGEPHFDGLRAVLVRPINNGSAGDFKPASEGDANISTESCFVDVAAKIARSVGNWIGRGW